MKLSFDLRLSRGPFELRAQTDLETTAVGLFGASGSGKTTLLHLLCGLQNPDAGRIELDGDVLFDSSTGINVPTHRRHIGMVFQENRLFPHYSVLSNLRYGHARHSNRTSRLPVDDVIDLLELRPLLDRSVRKISGGQGQRVALGRALLSNPRLLLLDEPLTALDQALRDQVLPFLHRVHDCLGVPTIIVSHRLEEILHLSDELMILDRGQLTVHGRYLDLVRDERAGLLLRESGLINVLHLRVSEHLFDSGITLLRPVTGEPSCGPSDTIAAPLWSELPIGEQVDVMIRPEDIALSLQHLQGVSFQNQLPGQLVRISTVANRMICTIRSQVDLLVEITPRAAQQLQLQIGQSLWCLLKSQAIKRLNAPHHTV